MRACEYCGEELVRKPGEGSREWNRRRFCGYSCSVRSRGPAQRAAKAERDKARMKRCMQCGTEFLPPLRNDRPSPYCSRTCSNRAKAERERRDFWIEEDRGYVTRCWVWQGTIHTNRAGIPYGRVSVGNRGVSAHRHVFERFRGPIPDGLHLDHLCEVTVCVNPDHLDPCTGGENTRRSWERGRHDAKRKAAA